MLVDVVHDLWASAIHLRWQMIGVLIAAAIFQDIFNAGYLFWNRPVSSTLYMATNLDTERFLAGDPYTRPFLDFWQMVE